MSIFKSDWNKRVEESWRSAILEISDEYGIEYVPNLKFSNKSKKDRDFKLIYLHDGRYLPFIPPNTGLPSCPIQIHLKSGNFFSSTSKFVITNSYAFKEITNLKDVLMKMVELFRKEFVVKKTIFDPYGFVLKLRDNITYPYLGRAKLCITDSTIVRSDEWVKQVRYINRFLDYFIGLNFGIVISASENEELENALLELNSLVIQAGWRESANRDLDVRCSNAIHRYELPVT